MVDEIAGEETAISVVTLAPVLVHPARAGRAYAARAEIAELEIEEIPLGLDAAPRLARLRADTRLRLPDWCVVLVAQDAGASTVATLDDRLRAALPALGLQPVA